MTCKVLRVYLTSTAARDRIKYPRESQLADFFPP
jgi:hypothetical protein